MLVSSVKHTFQNIDIAFRVLDFPCLYSVIGSRQAGERGDAHDRYRTPCRRRYPRA